MFGLRVYIFPKFLRVCFILLSYCVLLFFNVIPDSFLNFISLLCIFEPVSRIFVSNVLPPKTLLTLDMLTDGQLPFSRVATRPPCVQCSAVKTQQTEKHEEAWATAQSTSHQMFVEFIMAVGATKSTVRSAQLHRHKVQWGSNWWIQWVL